MHGPAKSAHIGATGVRQTSETPPKGPQKPNAGPQKVEKTPKQSPRVPKDSLWKPKEGPMQKAKIKLQGGGPKPTKKGTTKKPPQKHA